jgi:serine/threonine-protein kinase
VYDGWDELLQRPVAIKLLHPGADSHWSAERFCEEARTAARLSSPHVVTVYDFSSDGDPYLVLERMSGRTWADELRDTSRLPGSRADDDRTCQVLCTVLQALAEARALGVVHRDVKPGNVMLTDDGVPKLGDFGIAKSAGGDALTRTGEVLGSFAYVAPERAAGQSATPASDIWSVGIMAYEAFTGARPFTGDSAAAVVHAVLAGDHVPIGDLRSDLPSAVRAAVTRALSPDPTQRPTPEEFAAALSGQPVSAPSGAADAERAAARMPLADAAVDATAALPTTGHLGVAPPSVPWHDRRGRSTAAVLAGAAALVLVIVLTSLGTAGPPPADATTPAPTRTSTPTATSSSTAQPVARSSTSKAVVAPTKPQANDKKAKAPGKAKGHKKRKK